MNQAVSLYLRHSLGNSVFFFLCAGVSAGMAGFPLPAVSLLFLLQLSLTFSLPLPRPTNSRTVVKGCDTLIIGGTTAGVAAALAAVDAGGTNVCLLTNTDEVGGQLVQEGVPSIDFAWKSVRQLNVSQFSHDPSNLPSLFSNLLNTSESPGKCWVSVDCPELEALREGLQNLLLERSQHLRVFYNTVLSSIKSRGGGKGKGKIIDEVLAIQRTPSSSLKFCDGWDVPLSAQVEDWYSLVPSERYPKKDLLSFTPNVVVEATDWGEVLFLSRAPHLLGAQERLQWAKKGDKIEKHLFGGDVCGQATTVTFVEEMKEFSAPEPIYSTDVPTEVSSHYSLQNFPWQKVWTYRREFTLDPGMGDNVRTGDRTLQNWGGGNDNVFGYAFLPVGEEDVGTVSDGPHGLNLTVFEIGEQAAFGWHEYYRAQAPSPYTNRTFLVTSPQRDTRTCTGLSKVPYFRDSRRSVGMDGYVWPILDVTTSLDGMTSLPPFDRMGVGLYNVDFHLLQGCAYPKDVYRDYEVFPFFLPLRAFTNMKYQNLLVTGLNLAQSFLLSAATRTHPTQWASGVAAGVAAAYMDQKEIPSVHELFKDGNLENLQAEVAKQQPLCWEIQGSLYPSDDKCTTK